MSDMIRFFYDQSVALFDAGVRAGQDMGRQGSVDAEQMYQAHKAILNGVYGVSPISKAYAKGFLAGYTSVTSGVMQ